MHSAQIRTYPPAKDKLMEISLIETFSSSSEESLISPLEVKMTNAPIMKERKKRIVPKVRNKKIMELVEENRKLKKIIKHKKRQLKIMHQKNRRLQSKLINFGEVIDLQAKLTKLPPSVKTIIYMQLRHKPLSKWSTAERKISLSLYYKSPSLYSYISQKLKFNLPSVSTIRRWIRIIDLRPGFDTIFLKKLRQKIELLEMEEKECTILMDEMSIKKHLDYNEKDDILEGFEDFASEGGRSAKIASHAIAFMARGLYSNWSVPLAYYVSAGPITAKRLKLCLEKCMLEVERLGLRNTAIICDQGSNNRSVYKMFGVTKSEPYFFFNDNKIIALYDTPHLIKNVRNNLLRRDIKTGDELVTWRDIRATFDIDSNNTLSNTLLKITESHINPNAFEKMKVKLATQVFSKTFYSAMMTVIKTGELKSPTAKSTAQFILRLNDIFDCLNSQGNFDSNYLKRPLSDKNQLILKTLNEAIPFIESWSVEKNSPYCFEGLIQTINGTLQLWQDKKDWKPYLITGRLNQDPIENLFSKIRQRRGYDPNPSAHHFRYGLQSVMTGYLEKYSDNSNCQEDFDDSLCSIDSTAPGNPNENRKENDNTTPPNPSSNIESPDQKVSNEHSEANSLESNSITYFAGYLVKKFSRKYKCENCQKAFLNDADTLGDTTVFISYKDYGPDENISYLKIPSDNLIHIIRLSLLSIELTLKSGSHETGIKKKILENISKSDEIKNWVIGVNSDCVEHRTYILQQLARVKLFKIAKSRKAQKKNVTSKRKKLKVFQHS